MFTLCKFLVLIAIWDVIWFGLVWGFGVELALVLRKLSWKLVYCHYWLPTHQNCTLYTTIATIALLCTKTVRCVRLYSIFLTMWTKNVRCTRLLSLLTSCVPKPYVIHDYCNYFEQNRRLHMTLVSQEFKFLFQFH